MLLSIRPLLAGLLGCTVLQVAACGQPKEAEDPHVVPSGGLSPAQESAPAFESVDTPLTELERVKVVRTIDAGLGAFLQGVELEASLNEGKFEGFRIVRFRVPEDWRGVGLLVGDVVTSINDQPIERPEQAHAVFVSLRSAKALEIAYLRSGKPMRLSLPIVGAAPEPSSSETAEKGASTPAAPAPSPSGGGAAQDSKSPAAKKRAP